MKYLKIYENFILEISSDLLLRAKSQAYKNNQNTRAYKFGEEADRIKFKERKEQQQKYWDDFMSLTNGTLFGGDCKIEEVNGQSLNRVWPQGDTWITITNPTATFEYRKLNSISLVSNYDKLEFHIEVQGKPHEIVDIKRIELKDRRQAIKLNNFINWWYNIEIPFSTSNYNIEGIN